MNNKPLVVHDFFTFPGGGEKLVKVLADGLGATLWTGELNLRYFPEDFFQNSWPNSLKAHAKPPFWLRLSKTAQLWWAFSNFPRCAPAWTIFSGSLSLLAHKRIFGQKILYCHTPPRLLYDQERNFLRLTPWYQRWALRLLMILYKKAYARAIQDMDLIIANSNNVQQRIKSYLGLDSVVVHPPIETEKFCWLGQEDFYLSTARLDPLKRVDIIVEAFKKMPDKKLMVISGGSEEEKIKKMAEDAENIQILGWVSEEKLRKLMGQCIASIYIPRDEDFGMSPVESLAAGKPVIGVQEGGLMETIGDWGLRIADCELRITNCGLGIGDWGLNKGMIEIECGVLVRPEPDVEDMIQAVRYLDYKRSREKKRACEQRAKAFDQSVFLDKMKSVI